MKAVAPHSSTLAWRIPWTEEPGRLQSPHSLLLGFLGRTDRQDYGLMWENHPRRWRLRIHSFFFFETNIE